MIRVRPEKLDDYLKLHNPVWPDLATELKAAGMRNYALRLRPDGTEFGYLECDDWQATCPYLAKSEVHLRWQELMKDHFFSPADSLLGGKPVEMLSKSFLPE